MNTGMNGYQDATAMTAIYPDAGQGTDAALTYCALGLVGEAGEVANKAKKLLRDGDPHGQLRDEIGAELGDVLWYLARLAEELGVELAAVAAENLAKLDGRRVRGTLGGSGDAR